MQLVVEKQDCSENQKNKFLTDCESMGEYNCDMDFFLMSENITNKIDFLAATKEGRRDFTGNVLPYVPDKIVEIHRGCTWWQKKIHN